MRMTVNLEQDLYVVAKSLAREEDCSISAAVNKLLRCGLTPPRRPGAGGKKTEKHGFPVVKGDRVFTSDDVYRIDLETQ